MELKNHTENNNLSEYAARLNGYYDSISALFDTVSYDSEAVQKIVGLAYSLVNHLHNEYNGVLLSKREFADDELETFLEKQNLFVSQCDKRQFDFMIDSLEFFGNSEDAKHLHSN